MKHVAARVALALALAGCGGDDEPVADTGSASSTQIEEATSTATTDDESAIGNPERGKTVFAQAGCGGCHTLAAAGSSGSVGPNLDEERPSLDKVLERVTEGEGVMPSFKDQLSGQEIQDVAAFVEDSVRND